MNLPLFDLEHWFAMAEGRFDVSLSHSDCEPQNAADLLDADEVKLFANMNLGYGEFAGLAELQQSIADQYETIDPTQVVTFNGSSEAIYSIMRATLRPGDNVVVLAPLFFTLHSIARHIGCEVRE
ncbi:MAG: aminotransferase class I/II-fold pyridoxal phosphate-dependent enzyme [Fuerstiella sp.]